ncbi:phage head-tail connector protein [Metabacillus fastidiosus]|uniref:phage head-tail connector protein n=1 Tax=Metabacillus fastidiosus TaxID=1458 RepID=UPI003D2AE5EC
MTGTSLGNVKLILGTDISDTEKDGLINLYITRAENFVKEYCNQSELNHSMIEIAEDIAIFNYRNKGVENIKAESKGRLSDTYREGLPPEIYKRLNENRRLRFK